MMAGQFGPCRPVTASTSRGTPTKEPFTTTWSARTAVLAVTTSSTFTARTSGASLSQAHRHEAEELSCVAAVPHVNVTVAVRTPSTSG